MGWNTAYVSSPAFVVDWNSIDRNTGRQIDWTRVPESYRAGAAYTVKANGAALAAAVAITVDPLPIALPVGTRLDFTGAGEFAILTAPAALGATSLTVEALDAGIEDNDEATYLVSNSNKKVIPAGTVMCIIAANNKMVPRVARPGSEEAMGLLLATASEGDEGLTGYGVVIGGVIYENLLPETITSYKTELETNGTSWAWQTYADSSEV